MIGLHAGGDRGLVPGADLLFKQSQPQWITMTNEPRHFRQVATGKANTRSASKLRGSNG